MFTKLTLGMANILEWKANPVVKMLKTDGDGSTDSSFIGEEKIKSVYDFAKGLNEILKKILGPILTAIGMAAIIYAIYLGVQYAKAESAEKRKDVQGRLIGAIIGAVIIVVGATLCFSLNWAHIWFDIAGEKHSFQGSTTYCDWCGGTASDVLHQDVPAGE